MRYPAVRGALLPGSDTLRWFWAIEESGSDLRANQALLVVKTSELNAQQWLELDRQMVDSGWLPVDGVPAYYLRMSFMTEDSVLVDIAEKSAGEAARLAGIDPWEAVVVVGEIPLESETSNTPRTRF